MWILPTSLPCNLDNENLKLPVNVFLSRNFKEVFTISSYIRNLNIFLHFSRSWGIPHILMKRNNTDERRTFEKFLFNFKNSILKQEVASYVRNAH